ncbi:MAG: ribosomal protein S18-alanine N-acetyltransferase [Anaerovoracaceae bacterium]|jgi:ribosomal-protein-alanine N-acetyltransferase
MCLLIRKAEEKDIRRMAEIDELCFAVPWSFPSFEHEIKNNKLAFYVVAEVKGVVVGYAGLWIIVDEGHITNVAVHPDYRQKNIGEGLLTVLIAATRDLGATCYTLEVRPSNHAAISLYKKLGFKECGFRKNYYEDNNEDALIMWLGE